MKNIIFVFIVFFLFMSCQSPVLQIDANGKEIKPIQTVTITIE